MSVVDRFCNNLDKQDDLQEYDNIELDIKPFNSGEAHRNMRSVNWNRIVKNRREYYEMRSFLRGDGRDD